MTTKKIGKDQEFIKAVEYLYYRGKRSIQDGGWTWVIKGAGSGTFTFFVHLNNTVIAVFPSYGSVVSTVPPKSLAEPELLDKMYTFFIDYANQIRQKEDGEKAAKKEVESGEINNLLAGWVESRGCK